MVVATTHSYRSICNDASFPFSYILKDECCGFFTHLGVTLWIWNHGVPSIDELLRHFYALWMDSAETWQKIGEDIYVVYLATHGKRLWPYVLNNLQQSWLHPSSFSAWRIEPEVEGTRGNCGIFQSKGMQLDRLYTILFTFIRKGQFCVGCVHFCLHGLIAFLACKRNEV